MGIVEVAPATFAATGRYGRYAADDQRTGKLPRTTIKITIGIMIKMKEGIPTLLGV